MKVLMLVNWKLKYCDERPNDKQSPDYYINNQKEKYWFYKYFKNEVDVDVIDTHSCKFIEYLEKKVFRFYIIQSLKAIPKLNRYDLIVSHGMQSGVVISLWRKFFKTKAKHIVFDIGSFNSASEKGISLKLMQFTSKSIDRIIYHTSNQINYYNKIFPWLSKKSEFIKFGTDNIYFSEKEIKIKDDNNKYIVCVGYDKRDWQTLIKAYSSIKEDKPNLRLIGHIDPRFNSVKGVEQFDFIPIKELINQIYNAYFCILPLKSFNYSYGQMTLMQQMALKKCVIAARVPSLIDYVQDGSNAILYEPGNDDDLKNKMKLLINNYDLINRIGQNARKYIEKNNEKAMATEIEKVYISLLKG